MPKTLALKPLLLSSAFCAALVVIRVGSATPLETSAPSDVALLKAFQAHRAEFEQLRQMAMEDAHQLSFLSEATISSVQVKARRNEYRRLLRLSPNLEVGTDYNGTVRFIFSSSEATAVGPGWAEGIEFIPAGIRRTGVPMGTLDGCSSLHAGVYLREIQPRWFIFCQRDD